MEEEQQSKPQQNQQDKQQQQQPQQDQQQNKLNIDKKRTAILVLGMAGSGKTTFVQKLSQKIQSKYGDPSYIMNLDPAVRFIPYSPQTDIRQKIDIKKLMKSHGLGPNGAIVTAMNLYCTEIDHTIDEVQKSDYLSDFVVVDTPGQIEVFSWSASGSIISQALSTSMPTVLLYVIDIQRCMNPNSFMSNMMFALSIFYKMKLPIILVFNKEDVGDKQKLFTWMKDYDAFLEALKGEKSYLSTLSKTMVLNLDEFYQDLNCCGVSSTQGTGFEDLFPLIEKAREEYFEVTLKDLEKKVASKNSAEQLRIQKELAKFQKDKKALEKEIVDIGKKTGFNPMVNVFNVGNNNNNQSNNQEQNKTMQDLKKKKKQMDQEKNSQKVNTNKNQNEVTIEEEVSDIDLNKQQQI